MERHRYQWSEDNTAGYANAMGRYKTEVEWAFLNRHIPASPSSILDIGGGSGRFALPLARRGHKVTVIDLAADALRELTGQPQPNITVFSGDFLSAPLDEHGYDVAVAVESIQYLLGTDFGTIFRRVRTLLRPNGLFLFTQLNNRSWRYRMHRMRRDGIAYNVAGPAEYARALQASGFALREVSGFVWMPFGATSNSRLVPAFARLERALRLGRWIGQSPWLVYAAQSVP